MLKSFISVACSMALAMPVLASNMNMPTQSELARLENNWNAPHDLRVEAASQVALLPFPQQVEWLQGSLSVTDKGLQLLGDVQGPLM